MDPELRLTLLWHFGTTDPELLHEQAQAKLAFRDPQETLTFQAMLDRSRRTIGVPLTVL